MSLQVKSTVNVYVLKDGKLLLNRRANTGWMDGHLCAPGGHVEEGELPPQAMVREIKEVLGADVDADDLEFLCVAMRNAGPPEHVAFEFVIRDKDYKFTNTEPEKCSELVWVDLSDLPDDLIDDFRQVIERSIIGDEKYLELSY